MQQIRSQSHLVGSFLIKPFYYTFNQRQTYLLPPQRFQRHENGFSIKWKMYFLLLNICPFHLFLFNYTFYFFRAILFYRKWFQIESRKMKNCLKSWTWPVTSSIWLEKKKKTCKNYKTIHPTIIERDKTCRR